MGLDETPQLTADVERIVAVADPIVRNLRITQCYHELAGALAARTVGHANWCTFATWASKQAGQTIRREDFHKALQGAFDHSPAFEHLTRTVAERVRALGARLGAPEIRRIIRHLLDIDAALDRASDAVALGNLKVFAEIGHAFARFLAERSADADFDADAIAQFCSKFRDGEPPDGQRYLRQGFTRYYRALFDLDAKTRSELMFLANLEIGYHEQTRLQPEILAAMNAGLIDPDAFTPRLIAAALPRHAAWLARGRRFLRRLAGGRTPLDHAVRALVEAAQRDLRLMITEHLMMLTVPRGVVLRLGSDLPAAFPASLAQIEDADLRALLAQVDPTPDSVAGSGAADWGDLPERIHFIADFFRCYHASADLCDAPFDADQVLAIKSGHRPQGPL